MFFSPSIFIELVFFLSPIKIISGEMKKLEFLNNTKSPLVVFRNNDSKLVAAIPRANGNRVVYYYDSDDMENYIIACPQPKQGNILFPESWFKEGKTTESHKGCQYELIPSISKLYEGDTNTRETVGPYGVGYWVWNEKTEQAEFVNIYVVIVTEKSTHYTIHTIESLELFIRNFDFEKEMPENQYQLVPYYHMPVHSWRTTTVSFPFNIISLPRSAISYLKHVDDYIKTSIKEINKISKLYSGEISVGDGECRIIFRILQTPLENKGVAFITLIANSKRCSFSCYEIDPVNGWSFTPEENKKPAWYDLVALIQNYYPKFTTFICKAEEKLLESLNIDSVEAMEILKRPEDYFDTNYSKGKPPKSRSKTNAKGFTPSYLVFAGANGAGDKRSNDRTSNYSSSYDSSSSSNYSSSSNDNNYAYHAYGGYVDSGVTACDGGGGC